MKDKNILAWYPKNTTQEEADKLFNKEWNRDFYERMKIYNEGMESLAGFGTNKGECSIYWSELPRIFKEYNIKSFLDAGCSDYFIMKSIDFSNIKYVGLDFVKDQIDWNKERFPNVDFRHTNILTDVLPESDLVFCRDVLIHFSNQNIFRFLHNCLKSNCKYVMLGTYFDLEQNQEMGGVLGWRFINLEIEPYNFPEPLLRIKEPNHEPKKGTCLWRISDLENIIMSKI
jgi:hypothetical protein